MPRSVFEEVVLGLQIIKESQEEPLIEIEEGVIYAGNPSRMLSDDNRWRMERLNWRKDREFDIWVKQV